LIKPTKLSSRLSYVHQENTTK